MQYEIRTIEDPETGEQVPLINDRGQVQVRMTIDDKVLDQDFDIENLDENVKQGMAVFNAALEAAPHADVPEVPKELIGAPVQVKASELPDMPEVEVEEPEEVQ